MRKLALAICGTALLLPLTLKAYNTWGGADYADTYLGITWNKTWDKNTKTLDYADEGNQKASHWMADLPDNMLVAHVSIPGAHDFCTGEDNWSSAIYDLSSTTQAVTMREQMDRGIRGVDFRPGLHDDQLWCNHGIARTTKKLEEALDDMAFFLESHPSEFFVVHFFRGNVYNAEGQAPIIGGYDSDADRELYNNLMKQLFEERFAKYVVDFKPNLTVEEARGKMVLFTRDRIEFVTLKQQARITNWTTEFANSSNPGYITLQDQPKVFTKLHMQDISEGDDAVLNTKVAHMKNLIDFAQAQPTPNQVRSENGLYKAEWVFNFTSIDNSGSSSTSDNTNGYKGGASVMSPATVDYIQQHLGQGPIGTFFSDYVLRTDTKKLSSSTIYKVKGDELVYKIIENNFYGGENAPVVRYAIADTDESGNKIDWNYTPENPYEGQKYFLMNVGATEHSVKKQYLGAGGGWNGHSIVTDAAYPIELVASNVINGQYCIKSPMGHLEAKESLKNYYADGAADVTSFTITTGHYDGQEVLYFTDNHNGGRRLKAFHEGDGSFSDTPKFYCDPSVDINDNDPYQMWVLVSYSERQAEVLSKGKRDHEMDMSYIIPNYTMSVPDAVSEIKDNNYCWDFSDCGSSANHSINKSWNANFILIYNDEVSGYHVGENTTWSIKHTIPNLQPGKYILQFQIMSSNQYDEPVLDITGAAAASNSRTLWRTQWWEDQTISETPGYKNADGIRNYFCTGHAIYREEFEVTSAGDVYINFHRDTSHTSPTSFALGNVRLYYIGDGNNTASKTITVNFPYKYNTLILPFDADVPEGLKIFEALPHTDSKVTDNLGDTYEYHLAQMADPTDTKILANTPYYVYNESAPNPPLYDEAKQWENSRNVAPRRAEAATATTSYTFTGVPTNYHNTYHKDGTYLTGTIDGTPVTESHYYLQQTDHQLFFARNDNDPVSTPANSAYVNSFHTNAYRSGIYFEESHVLTGVESVSTDETETITDTTPVDVYSVGGIMLRRQVAKADALNELPRGIYILNAGFKSLKVAK